MKWMALMLMLLATGTLATTLPEARVAVWAANNGISAYTATFDGNRIVQINGSAALAAAAALVTDADAQAYIAAHTPEPYPTPDSVVPLVNTNGVQVGTARIVVDAVTMQPIAVVNSASPQRPWSEQRADVTTSLSSQASIVQALKGLKVSVTNSIATAQAIDPTAWTGAQRTQMQAVRKNLIDQAQAANTLRRMLLRYYRVED